MVTDAVKIVKMNLLFINDRLKKLHTCTVTIIPAHQKKLIVNVNGIILKVCIKREDTFDFLSSFDFLAMFFSFNSLDFFLRTLYCFFPHKKHVDHRFRYEFRFMGLALHFLLSGL